MFNNSQGFSETKYNFFYLDKRPSPCIQWWNSKNLTKLKLKSYETALFVGFLKHSASFILAYVLLGSVYMR